MDQANVNLPPNHMNMHWSNCFLNYLLFSVGHSLTSIRSVMVRLTVGWQDSLLELFPSRVAHTVNTLCADWSVFVDVTVAIRFSLFFCFHNLTERFTSSNLHALRHLVWITRLRTIKLIWFQERATMCTCLCQRHLCAHVCVCVCPHWINWSEAFQII